MAIAEIVKISQMKHKFEDNDLFKHTRKGGHGARIRPDLTIVMDGRTLIYDLKIVTHGTNRFNIEKDALHRKQMGVNADYLRQAKKIDEEMNSTKCADILRDSGKVRGLVTDTRGVLSSDFKEFIKLMAKSAAHANWESYGASSPRAAIGIFINLFNTRIGTAISRASAIWISKCCDDLRTYNEHDHGKPTSRNWQWKATRARHREQWREYRDCFDAAHHRQEGHGRDNERWL
jgi:hypothetical protein